MDATHWLMLSYHVPSEPSALRVATWRSLKQLGAVKLGDGLYYLPDHEACRAAIEELRERIQAGGGSAITMMASGLSDPDVRELESTFREARSEEFRQVAKSAGKLVAHIGREEAEGDYRFAELDALEEELEKVRRQFDRAAGRDYLGCAEREAAARAVGEAAASMGRYVELAYRRDAELAEEERGLRLVAGGRNG